MREETGIKSMAICIAGGILLLLSLAAYKAYTCFRINVPAKHIAVLIKKTGIDLENDQLVALDENQKGLQLEVLAERRCFKNPYVYDWNIYPMVDIPDGKMGVKIRLYGQNLPYGHFVATKENQKGIVAEVLKPGRYPINARVKGLEANRPNSDYVEEIEIHEPTTIPAGYRGVVTNLAGPIPENPNVLLVEESFRGVQKKSLEPGTFYVNPYMAKIALIDCRSQRFNLAESADMGFPSKDGFWVTLDGIIEFRVMPDRASEVYVNYNEIKNDKDGENNIDQEIIRKIIMPNALSFCRLRGSNTKGREFIGGETRTAFQKDFQEAIKKACEKQGIEIVHALITKIKPPEAIAKPVRDREVARQQLGQYTEQTLQQKAEAQLAKEKALIGQKQELVGADQGVVQQVTDAKQRQEVAITKANEDLSVARRDLEAAKDQAAAIMSRKRAEANIVEFQNAADAAGWKKAIEAFGGDGEAYAQFVLYQKLAPAFKSIMSNSADSPLMEIFKGFQTKNKSKPIEPMK